MEIQTGEPHIATFSKGKWIFYRQIVGWIGPLPVVNQKTGEISEPVKAEYDL